MSHFAYVTAAYAITVLTLGALCAWVLLDQRARKREVEELERRGVRRRSATGAGSS